MRVRSCGAGDASCLVLKLRGARVLLDCGADLSTAAGFAPRVGRVGGSEGAGWCTLGGQAFLEGAPHVWSPLLGAAALEGLDAVLLSSPAAMLALPYLTERHGYEGPIYAPAAALQIARYWMAELVAYCAGDVPAGVAGEPRWRAALAGGAEGGELPAALRAGLCAGRWGGAEALDPGLAALCWQQGFTAEEVSRSLARVTPVQYAQPVSIAGATLHAAAHASGECVGGAAWVLSDGNSSVGYLPAALPRGAASVATPLATSELQGLDALIVGHRLCCTPGPGAPPSAPPLAAPPAPTPALPPTAKPPAPRPAPAASPMTASPTPAREALAPSASPAAGLAAASPAAGLGAGEALGGGWGVDAVMAEVVRTVAGGGCTLLPMDCASDLPLLLINRLQHALQEAKQPMPAVYWLSPAAAPVLATATTSVEWLGEKQQRRVYIPKPPFPHDDMMKKGQLVAAASLSAPNLQWKEPCIALVSPLSWPQGPAKQLLQRWRGDGRNAVIFTRPSDDAARCLAALGGNPMAMRAVKIPLVPRHQPSDAAALLASLRPRHLLLPEPLRLAIAALPAAQRTGALASEEVRGYSLLEDAKLPLPRLSQQAQMQPELAMELEPLQVPGCPGISAARCSAWLALRDGRWELSSAGPLEEGKDAEHGADAAGKTCLWGRLTAERLVRSLEQAGLCAVRAPQQQAGRKRRAGEEAPRAVIHVVDAAGFIELGANRVHIAAASRPMRARMLDVVVAQLHSF